MMTFSEFVKNDALEKTVVSNCDNYRQKFIKNRQNLSKSGKNWTKSDSK